MYRILLYFNYIIHIYIYLNCVTYIFEIESKYVCVTGIYDAKIKHQAKKSIEIFKNFVGEFVSEFCERDQVRIRLFSICIKTCLLIIQDNVVIQ